MKKIDRIFRELSQLYDLNRKIKKFEFKRKRGRPKKLVQPAADHPG